jgi:hypothetical protein
MKRCVAGLVLSLAFAPLPARADVEVRVDKASQRMFVSVDGEMRHFWTVSTGVGGGPHQGVYRPQRLERKWHSRKYNMAPMPYSIFFDGNYAIHGTTHVRHRHRARGRGPSCPPRSRAAAGRAGRPLRNRAALYACSRAISPDRRSSRRGRSS